MRPVVKWVGGKGAASAGDREAYTGYHFYLLRAFLGGGAVLFHLQPPKAVVNDINEELINLYRVIEDNVDALIEELKKHRNEADYF